MFWSPGGRIHHANKSFCKLVGYTIEELRVDGGGKHSIKVHGLFHPEEMVKIFKRQLEAIQNPERSYFHMKTRLISKFHQEIPVTVSISNLCDTLGMPLLTIAHFSLV